MARSSTPALASDGDEGVGAMARLLEITYTRSAIGRLTESAPDRRSPWTAQSCTTPVQHDR